MRSWSRAAKLLVGLGWEIGPVIFFAYVAVNVSALVAPLMVAVGLRPFIDGLVTGNDGQVRLGAVVVVAGLVPLVIAPAGYRWTTTRFRERSIMVLQKRLLGLSTAAPRLEHFERPEFWDRLQLLRRSSFELAMGITFAFVAPIVTLELLVSAALLSDLQPALAVLPVIAVPAAWISQRAEKTRRDGELRSAEARRAANHLFSVAASAPSAKEVRIFDLALELLDRHRAASRHVHRVYEAALFRSVLVGVGGWLLFAVAYVVAMLIVLRSAGAGHTTVGDVALALSLAAAMVGSASRLSELAGNARKAVTASEHYYWLEDLAASSAPGTQAPPGALRVGIELQHVSFRYGEDDRLALDDVSVLLPAGSVIAVVGENGAGKTTLVKVLTGMYAPSEGHVLVDGVELADIDLVAYRQRLSAGFQDFMQFELLAREAVGVGDVPLIDDGDAVEGALRKANASFVSSLPLGAETPLGRSWSGGVDLSGGEWQKLAIARSMLRAEPLVIVLDEPTASLDPQTEHALFEQVAEDSARGRSNGRVTVLISHRFSTVRMADLIVVLDDGRVVEQGTHDELMASGGRYAELYELQARAYR
jgi:ATP-binding cassette subfamily B protein